MVFLHSTPREHFEKLKRQAARLVQREGSERDNLDDVFQTAWRLVEICEKDPDIPRLGRRAIKELAVDPRFRALGSVANAQKHGARRRRPASPEAGYVEVVDSSCVVTGGPVGASPIGSLPIGALQSRLILVTADGTRHDAWELAVFAISEWERIFALIGANNEAPSELRP